MTGWGAIAPEKNALVAASEKTQSFIGNTITYFSNPELWSGLLFIVIKVVLIWLAAKLTNRLAKAALKRVVHERSRNPLRFDPRRTRTIGLLMENVVTYAVNFLAILLILSQFNFNLGPLIAGAGVVGLAIGFGAQSIVKDVITGFFIIFEDQFAVGDVIQTGTYKGTVEAIGLRVTTIRAWTGEIFIIPNSQIQSVTNFSLYNSVAVVDLQFSVEEDIERAMKVLREILQNLNEKNDNIVKEPVLQGIQTLGETTAALRVAVECRPNTQAEVIRELNREIEKRLKDKELQFPPLKAVNYAPGEKG
jgi:small conductance mechanosensitive channel